MKLRTAALLLVALALPLVACGNDKTPKVLSGIALDPPMPVSSLSLPEANAGDADFTFKAKPDQFLIVYFGYTNCPDVCPTTLSEVKKALARVPDLAPRVDFAMATIDPARDTGEGLTSYVHTFGKTWHALRTDDDATLKAVTKGFGTTYSVTTDASGNVDVTHGGNLYVVDAKGTVVLEWPFGLKAQSFADDLQILFGKA